MAALIAASVFGIAVATGMINVSAAQIAEWAGWSLLAGTVVFFGWLYLDRSWTPQERGRLYVVGVFFLCAAIFWSVFEQAGSTLESVRRSIDAQRRVRLGLPELLVPVAERAVHHRLRADVRLAVDHARPSANPRARRSSRFGLIGVGAGFLVLVPAALSSGNGAQVSPMWLTATYLVHTWASCR